MRLVALAEQTYLSQSEGKKMDRKSSFWGKSCLLLAKKLSAIYFGDTQEIRSPAQLACGGKSPRGAEICTLSQRPFFSPPGGTFQQIRGTKVFS